MTYRNPGTTHTCPTCKAALRCDEGVLRCEVHGAFFAYGPQLLVRLPRANGKAADAPMPWESRKRETLAR
jgi:hypothetical protein